MCPIVDGSPVNAANTNAELLDAVSDDTALGILTWANTNPVSGPQIDSTQKEHNSIASYVGKTTNTVYNDLPVWTQDYVGNPNDPVQVRADELTLRFSGTTGHLHDGNDGEGPQIQGEVIANVAYRGYVFQGVDIIGVTGTSSNVSGQFALKSPSTNSTTLGVVVNTPQNKVLIRQASGVNTDDEYIDGSGNVVYARLTESSGTWTLSYYVEISGTETAYSFSSSSDVRFYYQELFAPLSQSNPPPVYSEFAFTPSDNNTSDVLTATTTVQGKTLLSSTAATEVGTSSTVGTTNATVANADHAHKGLHSIKADANAQLFGDVVLVTGTGITLSQAGQNITVTNAYSPPPVVRAGEQSITNGTTTQSVTFSSTFASNNYAVTCSIKNVTDSSPLFQPLVITAKSATGFTATWNIVVDSANYVLEYTAIENT